MSGGEGGSAGAIDEFPAEPAAHGWPGVVVGLDGGVVAHAVAGFDQAPHEVDVLADAELRVETGY